MALSGVRASSSRIGPRLLATLETLDCSASAGGVPPKRPASRVPSLQRHQQAEIARPVDCAARKDVDSSTISFRQLHFPFRKLEQALQWNAICRYLAQA